MITQPFPGLNLTYNELVSVVFVLVCVEVILWLKRDHPFALAIWLPVVALSSAACSGIAELILESATLRSAPEDMEGLVFLIDFVFLGPWIIAFGGAIFCRPVFHRQSRKAGILGSLVSAIMIIGLIMRGEITEATRFVILDPNGDPVRYQNVSVLSSHYGEPHMSSWVNTGSDGTFTLWISPGKSFFINVSGDSFFVDVRIWKQQDFPPSNRTSLSTYCDWDVPGNPERGMLPVSFSIGQKKPVPLMLKSQADLTAPYVRKLVREGLMEARDGSCPLNLAQLVSNPEALEQLDLISDVMSKQPSTRPALIEGLRWSGGFITHAHNATDSLYYYRDGKMNPFPPVLGAWLGLAPNEAIPTPGNVTSVFRQKVDALGLRLIQALSPYFGTEAGASLVILEMGAEGHPAIQNYAQAFPTATKRCQDQMLYNLGALKPTVSDVSWLVESGDLNLVLAGYDATSRTIKPEERALAKQRIDEALAKATDSGDIQRGKALSDRMGKTP
jgi:hypothetical protein